MASFTALSFCSLTLTELGGTESESSVGITHPRPSSRRPGGFKQWVNRSWWVCPTVGENLAERPLAQGFGALDLSQCAVLHR